MEVDEIETRESETKRGVKRGSNAHLGRKTAAAAASSLRINPLHNPLGTLLRSQINPAGV